VRSFHDPDRVDVSGGEAFVIVLEANPSTGYRWEVAPHPEALELTDERIRPGSAAPGAAGEQHFVFSASAGGRFTLSFAYRRPWEDKDLATKTVVVDVSA